MYYRTAQPASRSMIQFEKHEVYYNPITVKFPFELVSWDVMGPFLCSKQGNRFIIVATEFLTKWCEARVVPDAIANQFAQFLIQDVII